MADVTPIRGETASGTIVVGVTCEQHAYWCRSRGEVYGVGLSCCRGDQGELEFAWELLQEANDMFSRGDFDANDQQRDRLRKWRRSVDPMRES